MSRTGSETWGPQLSESADSVFIDMNASGEVDQYCTDAGGLVTYTCAFPWEAGIGCTLCLCASVNQMEFSAEMLTGQRKPL